MQEIARGYAITEEELVEHIVEGLRDKTLAASIFYNVTSLHDFKRLIPRYEKIVVEDSAPKNETIVKQRTERVRCFNCNKFGHYAGN